MDQIRKLIRNGNLVSSRGKKPHAFSSLIVKPYQDFMDSLDAEDGYPWSHQKQTIYILGEQINWGKFYGLYFDFVRKRNEKNNNHSYI